jgi:hypothetical protein
MKGENYRVYRWLLGWVVGQLDVSYAMGNLEQQECRIKSR